MQKNHFLLITLFFFGNLSFSQNINKIYLEDFSASIIYDSSSIIFSDKIKFNDGEYIIFKDRSSQEIVCHTNILNNKKNGVEILFYDGKVKKVSNYLDDLNNGSETTFYNQGKIASDMFYEKRILIQSIKFSINGKIESELEKKGEIFIETSYYPSGKLSQIDTLSKDKTIISSSLFCENGKTILYFKNYTSDILFPYEQLYCNGKFFIKTTCIKNNLCFVGKYEKFYENGNKNIDGQFANSKTSNKSNIKIGVWRFYSELGILLKEEHYSNEGELISTKKLK